jgi:hypothetical protein
MAMGKTDEDAVLYSRPQQQARTIFMHEEVLAGTVRRSDVADAWNTMSSSRKAGRKAS